jgi:hypothetical protein
MGPIIRPKYFILLALAALISAGAQAQPNTAGWIGRTGQLQLTDTLSREDGQALRPHALGLDFLISNGGFGLGTFYRVEYSDEFSAFIDFSISEAKDDDEVTYFDYYGRSYTIGKVNRFLVMPLFLGAQKRLFKDDILDNFRPYVNAAAGPALIYVFPEREEYFNALGRGHPEYTLGGYVGVGAYFGSEKSNILGLNLRYYFLPYPGGIEGLEGVLKKQFGGFFITLNFGNAW